ncbi:MAG TPA: HDOD domain-containing protein [Gemmatimonadaceae bacterium]|nr:HDOD domain-containing protein [Gemmatimonadaceae bacterium]
MEILVARQPVFDRREQLYGYDLVLRRPGSGAPGEPLPEQLVADTFLGIGIDQVAAGRRAFVTVDRDMLLGGAVRLLPADRVVLQIGDDIGADGEVVQICDQLVWSGYRFSIVSGKPEALPDELLRLAEIVKVDVASVDTSTLSDITAWLRSYHVRLLAMHVRHRLERDVCTNLGFELFEGYRFTAPETLTRRDLPIEHVMTFRLLKMVRDPRSGDAEIEDVLRRDVALSYKLLRMVNSAAVGGRDIWSIGHALRLLGREQVARWLGLLLVTDSAKDGVRGELVHLALVRARMCEMMADAAGVPRARGPLFLVGMLSLLDQLLETPMPLLADTMELAPDVRNALLQRADFYGAVLGLVEAYEQGAWDQVDALAQNVGVSPVALPPLYLEALAWATEQQRVPETKKVVGAR